MNLLSILSKVGGSILADVIPGGNAILNVVNSFLPTEKKLNDQASGADIQSAIAKLPTDLQTEVLNKKFDVEIIKVQEHTKVIQALADVDKTGNSTRPLIAKMMATVVCFTIVMLVSVLAVAIVNNNTSTIKAIGDNWPLIVAVLGTPTALLRSYFGMRTKEKQQKYQAVSNSKPNSIVSDIISLWKTK